MNRTKGFSDIGGVLLAGGFSQRMGRDKSLLPWRGRAFWEHCIENFQERFGHWVIVGRPGQDPWREDLRWRWRSDRVPGRGPAEGLVVGLEELQPVVPWALVWTIDSPYFCGDLVEALAARRGAGIEWVVPEVAGTLQGLTALYSTALAPYGRRSVEGGARQVKTLFSERPVSKILESEVRRIDPELASFRKIDTPEQYREWLAADPAPIVESSKEE